MTNLASNLALFGPSNLFVLTSMTYKQGEASFKRTSGRKQCQNDMATFMYNNSVFNRFHQ